jgi:hypothetical protein
VQVHDIAAGMSGATQNPWQVERPPGPRRPQATNMLYRQDLSQCSLDLLQVLVLLL